MNAHDTAANEPGVLDHFRKLGDGLLHTVRHRLELLSAELREEKVRLIQVFVWISATIFTGIMAVAFLSVSLVYLFGEEHRLAAFAGLTLFYILACVGLALGFKRYLQRQPKPFDTTLEELKKDHACLEQKS